MFNERNRHVWDKRENDRKVVVIISLLFIGVVIVLLSMTVWNPQVQVVFKRDVETEPAYYETLRHQYCGKHICLADLSKPKIYNTLRREVR